jgi:Protein of unknown function (DUF2551)
MFLLLASFGSIRNDDLKKKIDDSINNRLRKFLRRDRMGVRKYLIWFFLQAKTYTTVEVHDFLVKQGFNVNYRAVSAMVGQMHSRLGILRICFTGKGNAYTIREDYLDILKMIYIPFLDLNGLNIDFAGKGGIL